MESSKGPLAILVLRSPNLNNYQSGVHKVSQAGIEVWTWKWRAAKAVDESRLQCRGQ